MLLLTIDTAGKNGTVALSRVDAGVRVLGEKSLEGRQYSAQLIPALAALLAELGLKKTDLDAIAVTRGPGSFTGLRVGLAAAKGLAEILKLKLAAPSLLEAIAISTSRYRGETMRVAAAMDAGRREFYIADCELHPGDEVRILAQELVKRAELSAVISHPNAQNQGVRVGHHEETLVISPDASVCEILDSGGVRCEKVGWPTAETLARLAVSHFRRGLEVPPSELDADYIRRSDAEIFSAPFV